jgi:acyl-coenzyme A thioesterase 13
MLNEVGTMHGGCLAMIIEMYVSSIHGCLELKWMRSCSPMPIYILRASTGNTFGVFGVQQSLNIVFHSPGVPYGQMAHQLFFLLNHCVRGDKLRIVSTTLTLGSRARSGRCEVRF